MANRRRWAQRFDEPPMFIQQKNWWVIGGAVLVTLIVVASIAFFSGKTAGQSSSNKIGCTECQESGDAGYTIGGFCPHWKDVGFVQVFVDSYVTPLEYYALEEKKNDTKYEYRIVNENKSEAINVAVGNIRKLKSGDKIVVSNSSEDIQFNVVLYS